MRRLRTQVVLVCGLMFLAQAFAVSAAEIATGNAMPCHGHMMAGEKAGHCCDEAKCADMASCLAAQPAIAAAPALPLIEPIGALPATVLVAAPGDPFRKFLLRPPIALHA